MSPQRKGLGKGLGALISAADNNAVYTIGNGNTANGNAASGVLEIDINKIEPNRDQPRKRFDDESLLELAESLKQYGVIQPIIVKEEKGGFYSIIAGERRWRAARIAKLATLPAIIKDYTDVDVLQVALIENLQRQDLNPIEEAMCYKRLSEEYFYTQEDIAVKMSKSRNSISYAMGLLNLDKRVQDFIVEGRLTPGHARYLLQVKDGDAQFELAEHLIDEEATVRDAERLVKKLLSEEKADGDTEKAKAERPPHFTGLESDLRHILGTKVNIKNGKNRGKIEIEYYSDEEFDRLLGLFKKWNDYK